MPLNREFGPNNCRNFEVVNLTLEEYETIRLIDLEGKNQTEAAELMETGRTTVQNIYSSARGKIADAICNGKKIFIDGGNVFVGRRKRGRDNY